MKIVLVLFILYKNNESWVMLIITEKIFVLQTKSIAPIRTTSFLLLRWVNGQQIASLRSQWQKDIVDSGIKLQKKFRKRCGIYILMLVVDININIFQRFLFCFERLSKSSVLKFEFLLLYNEINEEPMTTNPKNTFVLLCSGWWSNRCNRDS